MNHDNPPVYLLDNAGSETRSRFPALATAFDPGTIRHLLQLDVPAGAHCLEVGGGGGSIAAWLAERVTPAGQVVVTDIDPRYLHSMKIPNVEIWHHDIVRDLLPESAFDLIHARLLLLHLPKRELALARMVSALKPGGWLVDEEFDYSVFPDPNRGSGEILSQTHQAMIRLMDDRGIDRWFGRGLFGRLRSLGLVDVGAEGRTFMWPSGSPGPTLMRANYEQLRAQMITGGYIDEKQFEHDLAALDHPDFLMPSPVLWTAWGRRKQSGEKT